MKKMLIGMAAAAVMSITAAASDKAHWDYDKHGPAHWGEFSKTCKIGKVQSPINIVSSSKISLKAKYALLLDESRSTTAKVYDNGHGIKVEPAAGGKMAVDGVEYKLLQFHFHGRSENTIDGHQFALEAHMVHQKKDGGLAVVGVMFEEGENNPLLDNILGNVGETIRVNPNDLLPNHTHSYYHWQGSLTTPPCSEGVEWFLMKEVVTASKEQIAEFRKYYNDNFRPTQPLNGRTIGSY